MWGWQGRTCHSFFFPGTALMAALLVYLGCDARTA